VSPESNHNMSSCKSNNDSDQIDDETSNKVINVKPIHKLNKNVFKSFESNQMSKNAIILRKTLSKDQNVEYDLIKNLSEKLIVNNYKKNPKFIQIRKRIHGYTIYRRCCEKQICYCIWSININIDTNEVILSCNKECQHINPNNYKGLF